MPEFSQSKRRVVTLCAFLCYALPLSAQEAGNAATRAEAAPGSEEAKAPAQPPSGPSAQETGDTVELIDGRVYRGRVLEPGGNHVLLELGGAAMRIEKREIRKVRFARGRHSGKPLDADLVILENGRELRGDLVEEGAQRVRIRLPSRTTLVLPRSRIRRVLHRGEAYEPAQRYFTEELAERIDAALEALAAGGATAREAEAFLKECGIFAIDRVRERREALAENAGERTEYVQALDRILRAYEIRKAARDEFLEVQPDFYEILESGSREKKLSLLKALLPAYPDECTDLVLFLARDPAEDDEIRAVAIEFLRRMQKNRELLELYNGARGRLKLAAAVALARNRVLFVLPTLIEALDLETPELRELAASTLREVTGQDFRFRAGGTPPARRAAIARWWAWWRENRESLEATSKAVLAQSGVDSPERKLAEDLWRQAHEKWSGNDPAAAEALLREALKTDPTFVKAGVSLAALLCAEKQDTAAARRVLQDLMQRVISTAPKEDRAWLWLESGHVARLAGDCREALDAYEECLALQPGNLSALHGAAECSARLALEFHGEAEERRRLLESALDHYNRLKDRIAAGLDRLVAMRPEELPVLETLPFERRAYNKSVLEVRRAHEEHLIRARVETARILTLLGNRKQAVLELREALGELELSPDLPNARELETSIRLRLALHYEALGNPELALAEYRKILRELDKTNAVAKRGLERIRRNVATSDGGR